MVEQGRRGGWTCASCLTILLTLACLTILCHGRGSLWMGCLRLWAVKINDPQPFIFHYHPLKEPLNENLISYIYSLLGYCRIHIHVLYT